MFGQLRGTPSTLAINMRGVGLSDPTQGTTELAVPVYIDGVFLGRGQGLGLDLIEPERIEILRGPQGQLFGRNAEGGVVQYVSRKPTGEFGVNASASYGNYNDQRYQACPRPAGGSRALPLSSAASMSKHDAYTEQTTEVPGRCVTARQNWIHGLLDASGFRVAVRWKNDAGFTADYTYDYTDNEDSARQAT